MITAYFKFEALPDGVKKQHGITGKSRLDCTVFANPSNYTGMIDFINGKGQMCIYKQPARVFIKPYSKQLAEWVLSNGTLNLSSIYYENPAYCTLGYGYPNASKFIGKNKNPNPLYAFRNDCYLFLTDQDLSKVEILVIQNGRNYVTHCYKRLLNGYLDSELQRLRSQAKPFFNYGSSL